MCFIHSLSILNTGILKPHVNCFAYHFLTSSLWIFVIIIFMVVKKLPFLERVKLFFLKTCKCLQKGKAQENNVMEDECKFEDNPELPDRVIHPEHYV